MTIIQAKQQRISRREKLLLLVLVVGVLSSCSDKLRVLSGDPGRPRSPSSSGIISFGSSELLARALLWNGRGGAGGTENGGDGGFDEQRVKIVLETKRQDDDTNASSTSSSAAATLASGAAPLNQQQGETSSHASATRKKSLRRLEFLDRIALISAATLRQESAQVRDGDAEVANAPPPDADFQSVSPSSTSLSISTLLEGEESLSSDVSSKFGGDEDEAAAIASINSRRRATITPQSDLSRPGRHIHVVTTAALPWFTGTAVNPLLRAAYLHRKTQEINASGSHNNKRSWVTLVVPWLELPEDQQELYGRVFADEGEQELYVREWLASQGGMPDASRDLKISWYPARYHPELRSIFAMGDIMSILEEDDMDVCVLEEPEHLNWYRAPGDGWTRRFHYVVGVVHTNYKEYASSHYSGLWTAPAIALMSSAMVRAYCHKVIKLSSVLQTYAPEKEAVSNVHGVRADFLEEGRRRAAASSLLRSSGHKNAPAENVGSTDRSSGEVQAYFIGKLLWAKGLDIMLELEDYYKQCTGAYFAIDVYGSGPDQKDIMRAFHGRRKAKGLVHESGNSTDTNEALSGELSSSDSEDSSDEHDAVSEGPQPSSSSFASFTFFSSSRIQAKARQKLAKFKQKFDSVELPKTFHELRRKPIPAKFPGRVDHAEVKDYSVFVNPSTSEVLCTTTAEALAMGKFAVIPVHPSNAFFLKFPNCLAYRNKFEFVANLRWALTHDPEPLSPALAREFTWEAATERFLQASSITYEEAARREKLGLTKLDERIAWFHNEIGKGATGDMLRKIFGAGPAAHQSRYAELQKAASSGGADDEEDEDDGLSRKFRRSSFAEALRATVADLGSFIQ